MKRVLATLAVGSLVVLATACSEEGQAEPQGSLGPSSAPVASSSSAELPHSGAPAVDDPLPKSAVSGDPCDTLTSEQVKTALGERALYPGERDDDEALGKRCRWSNPAESSSFVVGFQTETGEGLSAVYANAKPQVETFSEAPAVVGYPAVTYKRGVDDPMCSHVVGVANEYAVSVTGTLSTASEQAGKDPCKAVQQVASWVVAGL